MKLNSYFGCLVSTVEMKYHLIILENLVDRKYGATEGISSNIIASQLSQKSTTETISSSRMILWAMIACNVTNKKNGNKQNQIDERNRVRGGVIGPLASRLLYWDESTDKYPRPDPVPRF